MWMNKNVYQLEEGSLYLTNTQLFSPPQTTRPTIDCIVKVSHAACICADDWFNLVNAKACPCGHTGCACSLPVCSSDADNSMLDALMLMLRLL